MSLLALEDPLHGGLDQHYSLCAFLNGTLEETEGGGDHNEILLQAGRELQALALAPKIDTSVVEQFLSQVKTLGAWQRTVAKYSPDGLIMTHHSLRPQGSRVIAIDSETVRASRILKEKMEVEEEGKPLAQRYVVR